jgi:hypothetical protein
VKPSDVGAVIGKLEGALDSFQTAFDSVEKQWSDVARREFEEDFIEPMEPHVKKMLDDVARLATVLANANQQCSSEYQ